MPRRLHKILPPNSAELEALAKKEAALEPTKKTRAEVERKIVGSTVKAPTIGSGGNQRLLEEVATNWTCGKSCSQTGLCLSAIRNCLLQGMKAATIANYVACRAVPLKDRAVEVERIKSCAYRVNKSLKESGEGAASKGVSYQRNGVVATRDDVMQKSFEEVMAALTISANMKDTATQCQGNPKLMAADQAKNEQHWMVMWRNARSELKKLREDRKGETDTEVLYELKSEIDALKKKRDEWAALLGMKEE